MQVTKSKSISNHPGHTIEIGGATWDNQETSVRNRYPTKSGGFSPRSSSEIPLGDIKEIVTVIADEDLLNPKDLAALIAILSASLSRQV
jgi:hypothetical protein